MEIVNFIKTYISYFLKIHKNSKIDFVRLIVHLIIEKFIVKYLIIIILIFKKKFFMEIVDFIKTYKSYFLKYIRIE